MFGTYHWANESGKDLHCGGPSPEKRCEPYQFSGRYPCVRSCCSAPLKSYISACTGGRSILTTLVDRVDGSPSDFSRDFHVYSIDWNETTITWSIDGQQCAQCTARRTAASPLAQALLR